MAIKCVILDGKCNDPRQGQMGRKCYDCHYSDKKRQIPLFVPMADCQFLHEQFKKDDDYNPLAVHDMIYDTALRFWEMGIASLKRHVKEACNAEKA